MEELARLESSGDSTDTKIRVKMPNKKVNEMFALASQILGGRRALSCVRTGKPGWRASRGKMRRRQWVREGDLIIVWPWDFQDSKADVKHRYTKTQAMYLSRKGVLPDDVDMFGMNASIDEGSEHDDLFAFGDEPVDDATELEAPEAEDALFADDEDNDDLFADDGDEDDLFADEEEDGSSPDAAEAQPETPVEAYPDVEEEIGADNGDDDDDIDALFA